MATIELRTAVDLSLSSLLELYTAVGWMAYISEERQRELVKAVENTSFVVSTWDGDKLVGLARALSDDASICYIQDILVHPDYQRRGIGERMIQACLTRYAHVRSTVLMTDDEDRQSRFYEKAGFRNIKDINAVDLNVYVQMDGLT